MLCTAYSRRHNRYPLESDSAPRASRSHAARRVRPFSTAVAKQKSVSVRTTKPESNVVSITENVRPQPGRWPRFEQKTRRPRATTSESRSA